MLTRLALADMILSKKKWSLLLLLGLEPAIQVKKKVKNGIGRVPHAEPIPAKKKKGNKRIRQKTKQPKNTAGKIATFKKTLESEKERQKIYPKQLGRYYSTLKRKQ